jgi:hypothetical protein
MEDQHKKITGYRDLTETEIADMNEVKELGDRFGVLIAKLRSRQHPVGNHPVASEQGQLPDYDQRWVSIGTTDIQTGCMALVRAIARPTA